MFAATIPAWAVAGRRVRERLRSKDAPAIALGGAFSFVIMLFNVPVASGTSAHAVGAALVALALGPAAAVVALSVALAIQALLFSDGGLLVLGANCFNMAVAMPLVGYAVYQAVAAGDAGPRRRAAAAALAGYAGINVAAFLTALELGVQPALEPGHCPLSLRLTMPAMMISHLLVVGPLEGAVTAGALSWLGRGGLGERDLAAVSERAKPLWITLGALCLASPLGLLAAGAAFGEERLLDLWSAPLPDYTVPGIESKPAGYVLSALAGVAAIAIVAIFAGRILAGRERGSAPS
jgi:cobalt/nickel transport system permease protein